MPTLSPEKVNGLHSGSMIADDDFDMTFHDPPSSPFISHIENDDQENIAPDSAPTPVKPFIDITNDVFQIAFKVSPEKRFGLRDRASLVNASPAKNLVDDFEEAALKTSPNGRVSPKKGSTVTPSNSASPLKLSRPTSIESHKNSLELNDGVPNTMPTPSKHPSSSHNECALRDNEGLTVAMRYMEKTHSDGHEDLAKPNAQEDDYELDFGMNSTEFNPDGPEITSADIDDTCFSTFSEMPGLDMTKFAFLKQSPAKDQFADVRVLANPLNHY